MFRVWEYSEKSRTKAEKKRTADAAASRLDQFRGEDPSMPWFCRDPATIKRDHRYQALTANEQEKFNRLVDEMWMNQGWSIDNRSILAELLCVGEDEAERLKGVFLAEGLIEKHGHRLIQRDLREQYVRAVNKSETAMGHPVQG